jgi:hypothetical protein
MIKLPHPDPPNSTNVLYYRSKYLQQWSDKLRREANELCYESKRLRKTQAFASNGKGRDLSHGHDRIHLNLSAIETRVSLWSIELIRMSTPGFNRNAARKIIELEI